MRTQQRMVMTRLKKKIRNYKLKVVGTFLIPFLAGEGYLYVIIVILGLIISVIGWFIN